MNRLLFFSMKRSLVVLILFIFNPLSGFAHPLDPVLFEFKEMPDKTVEVIWKAPASKIAEAPLLPIFPSSCRSLLEEAPVLGGASVVQRFRIDCAPMGLVGATIGVIGLQSWKTDALLRIVLSSGRVVRAVLRGDRASFQVPPEPAWTEIARDYIRLGVEHILLGFDHLLFVLGLVLLVRNRRMLLATVTSFTVGHSVTLSLAVLGLIHVPQAPVEALIALSILVVAMELWPIQSASSSFGTRYSWAIAIAFGFLHGLGFAGALAEVGLPEKEIPLALLNFNIGIELGQLIFIALVLVVIRALRSTSFVLPKFAPALPAYLIGSLAAYWMFERIVALL